MNFYSYTLKDFRRKKPGWEFRVFPSRAEQSIFFARDLIKRIKANEKRHRKTAVILPVGPIDYKHLVDLSNNQDVSLKNLVIFFMDEYSDKNGTYIDKCHPLSFRGFIDRIFYNRLNVKNRMPYDAIIFPDGNNPDKTTAKMKSYGQIEVTYGGFGINGHLAFNEPPEQKKQLTEKNVRFSSIRTIRLSRETLVQNAIAGTGGNMDIIPRYAVTLGMKELLSAKEIHLYLLRTWHSGIMRRALFGPVNPQCPGSYVQLHNNIRVYITRDVLKLPAINVTLNIGSNR